MNISINVSSFLIQNVNGTLEDIQLKICTQYQNHVLYPLIFSIVCLLIRWFVIYWLIDLKKHPRAFQLLEILFDVGALMGLVTSIIWLKVV